jgi:hypothetical protein
MTLKKKNVVMNYVNYETAIVEKYKVDLVGWPATIKFANPSAIGTVDDIRALRNALKTGECKWIIQTKRQQAMHAEMLKNKREAGVAIGKKRKERSDKGKKRKMVDESGGDGEEDEGEDRPPKKKRRKRLPDANPKQRASSHQQ